MILKIIFTLAFILLFICVLVSIWDCNRFVVREYEVDSPKITKACTLVLLSDLHNKAFGNENSKLLQRIDSISPDAILIAGDMLTAEKNKDFENAASLTCRLAQRYKLYYGMGNHEYRLQLYPEQYGNMYERYEKALHQGGVHPLINENVSLPGYNLAVCGAQIDRCYYKRFGKYPMSEEYLPQILGEKRGDQFQILIAHNPDYFGEYAKWGADLVVSGHVHGGIMRLPVLGGVLSPNLTLFPKYDGGMFRQGDAVMVLSRGLGTHTIPLRIFNPGELVVIKLQPDK